MCVRFRMFNRPKPMDFTRFPRRILWFFGLYYGGDMGKHYFHRPALFLTMSLVIPFPILILTHIFLEKFDLVAIAIVHYIFLHIWVIFKILLFLNGLPKLQALEDQLQSDVFNSYAEGHYKFLRWAMRKQLAFFKLLCSGTLSFTTMFTVFLPGDNESLNIPIWTPVKLNRMTWHIYEVLCYIISASVYPGIDCTLTGFIANMTAQLQILRDNLRKSTVRDPEDEYWVQERKIQIRLESCIVHHNAIFDFVSETERIFSISLFCQILFSVLGICLSGFQFLVVTNNSGYLLTFAYLTVMFFQIYFSCWFVEELIEQGTSVIESCYFSDWYTCTTSTKKLFFLIMERAKRPIKFNAGYFFALTLATFVMILRSSYSYFAILRQVYQ